LFFKLFFFFKEKPSKPTVVRPRPKTGETRQTCNECHMYKELFDRRTREVHKCTLLEEHNWEECRSVRTAYLQGHPEVMEKWHADVKLFEEEKEQFEKQQQQQRAKEKELKRLQKQEHKREENKKRNRLHNLFK